MNFGMDLDLGVLGSFMVPQAFVHIFLGVGVIFALLFFLLKAIIILILAPFGLAAEGTMLIIQTSQVTLTWIDVGAMAVVALFWQWLMPHLREWWCGEHLHPPDKDPY